MGLILIGVGVLFLARSRRWLDGPNVEADRGCAIHPNAWRILALGLSGCGGLLLLATPVGAATETTTANPVQRAPAWLQASEKKTLHDMFAAAKPVSVVYIAYRH